MKVTGIRWIGVLTDDHVKKNDFLAKTLGLNQEGINNDKGIAFFRFPVDRKLRCTHLPIDCERKSTSTLKVRCWELRLRISNNPVRKLLPRDLN
jgi:hypothetical protein